MVVIFAGVRGFLDSLDVSRVGQFEEHLLQEIRANNASILETIRTEGEISDETEEKLKAIIEPAAKSFDR